MIRYASILYLLAFSITWGYKTYIITPTHNILQNPSISAVQKSILNNTIASIGPSEAHSLSANSNTVLTLILEIVLLTSSIYLEMKYHLFSKLWKIWWIRDISTIVPLILFAGIAIYIFGWLYGIALSIIGLIALFGIYYVLSKLAKKFMLAAFVILLSYMIIFLLLQPISSFISSVPQTQNIINIIFLGLTMGIALITIKLLGDENHLKTVLNFTAAISCISFAIYFGLLINVFWLILLLACFSIYDWIAVQHLGTMQWLAKRLYSENIPGMFLIGSKEAVDKKINQLTKKKEAPQQVKSQATKQKKGSILGSGDIAIPAAVIASSIYYLPHLAVFFLIGAIAGIILDAAWLYFLKPQRGIPALPIIGVIMCAIYIIGVIL